jgi:carboxypeptidase C (cathepsin A)
MALTPSIAHIRLPHPCGVLSKSKVESWCLFICVATNPADRWSRFILGTESYGGHYGPEFVTYFDQQNALVRSGKIQGVEIVVSALMINE